MNVLRTASILTISFACACRPMTKPPETAADRAVKAPPTSSIKTPLELTIKPAAPSVTGGQRLPLQFTLRNTGDQPVHACLASGRVVHLWGIDKQYAYTVAEHAANQSPCEETLDLAPKSERSWNEEMVIPAMESSSAKIVGFAQVVPSANCSAGDCQPVWLTASYSPFQIEEGAAAVGPVLDLRTGAKSAALVAAPPLSGHRP